MNHRKPTRLERTNINRALAKWGIFDILKDGKFIVREDCRSRHVCLVTPELETALAEFDMMFCGLAIGNLAKNFQPTMEGADMIARLLEGNCRCVMVTDNAEKLVLYGRDIMGDSILKAANLSENDLVIITNKAGDALGIGRARFAGNLIMQKGRITVTTITDAGHYLREESNEGRVKMSMSPQQKRS